MSIPSFLPELLGGLDPLNKDIYAENSNRCKQIHTDQLLFLLTNKNNNSSGRAPRIAHKELSI